MISKFEIRLPVSGAAIVLAAFMAFPAVALPPVIPLENCPLVQSCEASARTLTGLVAESGQPPVEYEDADLEGGTGDGVPDYYQLLLLASALCTGDPVLNQTFEENRAVVTDYLTVVDDLVQWALAAHAHAETAQQELDLFTAWPLYSIFVPSSLQPSVVTLQEGLATLIEATEFLNDPSGEVDVLLEQIDDMVDIIAVAGGLSTEMLATFQAAVEGLLVEVSTYQSQIPELAATLEGAAGLIRIITLYPSHNELADAILAVAGDLRAADELINRLHFPALEIYGTGKTAGEPFSGLGDYDGDGSTNAAVYSLILGRGQGVAQFVGAASGADPFYQSENVPAAGAVGLAVLAAIIAVAGAFVLFRRPRR